MDFELLVPLCKAAFINERPTLLTVRQYGQRIPKAFFAKGLCLCGIPQLSAPIKQPLLQFTL
jgi:hypothetical protein